GALAADENRNATLGAVGAAFASPGWNRSGTIAFSSTRKWSATSFTDEGSWIFGAPEMVLAHLQPDDPARQRADELASEGRRVLVLAYSDASLEDEALPGDLQASALVLLAEKVRPDAAETLAYFADQGVTLKVISGDNPRTVAAVARSVGLPGADDAIDGRDLPEDQAELAEILEQHSVFGRVTPHQKRAMVGALQSKGHVVAMTGDGVNDALALKDADIGVAMGSGAAATRAVAQLVLLDGKFASMPGVVAEGRRVIANIERSANLFVTKTVYAVVLAVVVVATGWLYPFLPRHLTIVSTFTIGVPGFFLALAPNKRRYVPGFLERVVRFCVPAGLVAGTASLLAYALAKYEENLVPREARTTTTLVLVAVALWVLVILARPFTMWKGTLVGAMVGAVALILVIEPVRDFYALDLPEWRIVGEAGLIAAGAIIVLEIGWRASRIIGRRREPVAETQMS
ncbi:MAG: HAD family hydrolase, partial [Acidimicrobiia bacterium]|nr:HAD family hydrolase [Acidimicrobiia bacterium]